MHMVSKRGLWLCRIGDHEENEESDDSDDSQRRGACKRRGKGKRPRIGFFVFVTVMLLEDTPAVVSLGKLCEDHGNTYHWTSGQKPHLTNKGKIIGCNISNDVPLVVLGLSTSSSTTPTPTSSTSSSQDSVSDASRYTENPVPERSGSTSEELQGNPLHKTHRCTRCLLPNPGSAAKPTKNPKPNKNENHDIERGDLLCSDIPEWLQEYREHLVDDGVPEHRDSHASSSHEPPLEPKPTRSVDLGKHSVYTHFPKDRNCEISQTTKITKARAEDAMSEPYLLQKVLVIW